MILELKVKPGSSREELVPKEGEPWVAYIRQAPEKGKANEALRRLLADWFQVSKSRIQLLKGETSRLKRVMIETEAL